MHTKLYELFKTFCQLPECEEERRQIEENHKALAKALKRKHRRMVLAIIDNKDAIHDDTAFACFIQGFNLAKELNEELAYKEILQQEHWYY